MYTYLVDYNDGQKKKYERINLTELHKTIVSKIKAEDLIEAKIKCPNGIIRRVRKTGAYHHNHDGFEFD